MTPDNKLDDGYITIGNRTLPIKITLTERQVETGDPLVVEQAIHTQTLRAQDAADSGSIPLVNDRGQITGFKKLSNT